MVAGEFDDFVNGGVSVTKSAESINDINHIVF